MADEKKLAQSLAEHQSGQNERITPLRNRLEVVNSLIEKHTDKLNRLLDIYLSGDVDKAMFLAGCRRKTSKVSDRAFGDKVASIIGLILLQIL